MTKDELAEKVAKATGFNKQNVLNVINSFTEETIKAVGAGDPVTIREFGTFKPVQQKARKVQNISLKQTMIMPAQVIPKFVPAKDFKSKVRDGGDIADHLSKQPI